MARQDVNFSPENLIVHLTVPKKSDLEELIASLLSNILAIRQLRKAIALLDRFLRNHDSPYRITNFVGDDFFNVTASEDHIQVERGADGSTATVDTGRNAYTVTLNVMALTADARWLGAATKFSRRSGQKIGIEATLDDGTLVFYTEKASLMRPPDTSFGSTSIGPQAWTFECENCIYEQPSYSIPD